MFPAGPSQATCERLFRRDAETDTPVRLASLAQEAYRGLAVRKIACATLKAPWIPKLYQPGIFDSPIVGQQWNIQSPGGSNNDAIGRITWKFFGKPEKLFRHGTGDLSQAHRLWMNRFLQPIGRAGPEFDCAGFYQNRQFPKTSHAEERALSDIIERRDNLGTETRQPREPPDPDVGINERRHANASPRA